MLGADIAYGATRACGKHGHNARTCGTKQLTAKLNGAAPLPFSSLPPPSFLLSPPSPCFLFSLLLFPPRLSLPSSSFFLNHPPRADAARFAATAARKCFACSAPETTHGVASAEEVSAFAIVLCISYQMSSTKLKYSVLCYALARRCPVLCCRAVTFLGGYVRS